MNNVKFGFLKRAAQVLSKSEFIDFVKAANLISDPAALNQMVGMKDQQLRDNFQQTDNRSMMLSNQASQSIDVANNILQKRLAEPNGSAVNPPSLNIRKPHPASTLSPNTQQPIRPVAKMPTMKLTNKSIRI